MGGTARVEIMGGKKKARKALAMRWRRKKEKKKATNSS